MAEAEDVLVDAARHATVFARRLWTQRHPGRRPDVLELASVAERLAILIQALLRIHPPFRVAQEPAPPTFLTRVFRSETLPLHSAALPATDGFSIWLPRRMPNDAAAALGDFRCMALLQAARIVRGSADDLAGAEEQGVSDLYLLIEAAASERMLAALLPGMAIELHRFRAAQFARRPRLDDFPPSRRPLEELARSIMSGGLPDARIAGSGWSPPDSRDLARSLGNRFDEAQGRHNPCILYRDLWTGELRAPVSHAIVRAEAADADPQAHSAAKSARLARRPEVRAANEGEDDERPGAWMIQAAQPAESAEDPFGMQRPTDIDEDAAADEYADSVSELGEARLVSTLEQAREILVSDDPPDAVTRRELQRADADAELNYPEWDYRQLAYRLPGARVRLQPAVAGSPARVAEIMRTHRGMCEDIRRRFEMLRAARLRTRKQPDGDDIDIDACVEARADFIAGLPMAQGLYQSTRLTRRDMAITLLIDISGSTDSWISEQRRVIDVEREAVLLVCHALQGLREPYSVLAFSGEGPGNVVVREIKTFDEPFSDTVACRIVALEPEHYTRAGAALRHATARLVQRTARHRLLLLLSDGKPNDNDEYDGRYGAEDMRQSVTEARLQGIYPFCLTIDRLAAGYLHQVFGANHYAMLHKPELLPAVLLEWMRRLIAER
jgi:nitric oxide reductase NorD protein